MKRFLSLPYLFLPVVILLALGLRLYNLYYNSPFLDEAIYVMLGEKFLAGTWQEDSPFSWVGGMPLFYPFFSAVAYNIGGIVGSRLLNVLLGVTSTYLIFLFVKNLNIFDERKHNVINGIVASLFFAIAPVPLWLSRLAIYDMLSYTFFMLNIVLLQAGIQKNNRSFYFLAVLALFFSFLAKFYILRFSYLRLLRRVLFFVPLDNNRMIFVFRA